MQKVEEKIRNHLMQNIAILGDGLRVIEKESFLPNSRGTRGFIDILAQDSLGRFVIIEIKRSKAASREAIHEVLKYIDGIKENKSLKNDEIAVIVVSTEWKELLAPFSIFVSQVRYSVTGYVIEVDGNFKPLSANRILPLPINNERSLSDQHSIRFYSSKESLENGLKSHQVCFADKGIGDFVLLVLEAPPERRAKEISAVFQGLRDVAEFAGGTPRFKTEAELAKVLPEYKYIIYSAVQTLNDDEYFAILEKDEALAAEAIEYQEGWREDGILSEKLHEYAIENAKPLPLAERIEISYPAKLARTLLENECWEIKSIVRSGRLLNNQILEDEVIIGELTGNGGSNRQTYSKNYNSVNSASFDQIAREIQVCLADNPIWLAGALKANFELKALSEDNSFQGRVHIFNPSNTLLSIYQVINSEKTIDALRWIPSYYFIAEGKEIQLQYCGFLSMNAERRTLTQVIDQFYDGNPLGLLMTLNWGGYESRDFDISASFGLEYSNYLIRLDDTGKSFFKFDGFRYRETAAFNPYDEFLRFVKTEEVFADGVQEFFQTHAVTPGLFSA